MRTSKHILLFLCAVWASALFAQGKRITREEYIARYQHIAVADMERFGIPASITLAQGILESDCGNSRLALSSNNHFGIKCKKNWTGDRVFHDDDAPGECFRAYPSVEASYRDHSEFLDSQPRYDSLFNYAATDYRSWARGLKAAGYATAPDYAQRLIRIIEESRLYLFDHEDGARLWSDANRRGGEDPDAEFESGSNVGRYTTLDGRVDPDNYRVTINAYKGYDIYAVNGVNYVVAKEGDTFESLGATFRLSARNLRKFNDLGASAQPVKGEPVFIGRKQKRWEGNARQHIVAEGETLHSVAQSYGLRDRSLRRMNRLRPEAPLEPGQHLRIQ